MDELHALVQHQQIFRTCSLLCFSETWLNEDISDKCVSLDGFTLFRGDRQKEAVGKKTGGGVCVYVNKQWCHPNNTHVKFTHCSPLAEVLTVSARPYYLPREFSHVLVVSVYVPPSANAKEAAELIAAHVHDLETSLPDTAIIITGDFNQCSLEKPLPSFHQHVKCATRGENTLDLFYSNVKDGYTATPLPPLGRSDHDLVSLAPRYRPRVQREPVVTKTVKQWSTEAWEALRGCFACTDWSVFTDANRDVSDLADTVGSYISFCVDSVVPSKTVKVYPNNKPWVTKQIKTVLNKKKKSL